MITTPCTTTPEVFQHPLVEDAPAVVSQEQRSELVRLVAEAGRLCADCPVFAECLYRAVVDHDVAGIAAGTTETQRRRIRRLLGVAPGPEDLDDLAGVVRGSRLVSHEQVVRLRRTNPDASLDLIASWLGCSLSTVKRHLRQARQAATAPAPRHTPARPEVGAVLTARAVVVDGVRARAVA